MHLSTARWIGLDGLFVITNSKKFFIENLHQTRKRFNFGILGLDQGTVLQFKKDSTITCTVANDTQVNFRGELMSLSRSADIVLREMGYDWVAVQGTV